MIEQIEINERKIYRLDGSYHRPNGPAVVGSETSSWWLYGMPHRYYGPRNPAPSNRNGRWPGEWWIHGVWMGK